MSNIPAGYKQTEVGVIPGDWEIVCLGEMTIKVGSGITPTGGKRVYKKEGRPFLRSQNVGWGCLLMDDIAFIDDNTHETFNATEIMEDDVFLNITGASIGRSAVADSRVKGGNVNQHVCIIRTVKDKLNPHFLNFTLLSKVGQKQIDSFQAGGNRQGLNFGQIRSFQIPLPPTKAEQTTIAAALSDADALITSFEKLIAKKRKIKQGAMQELLKPKEGWVVKKLGEVCQILKGTGLSKSKLHDSGIHSCILYGELFTTYKEIINEVISKTNVEEGTLSKKGDILFPGSTTTTGIDLAKSSALMLDRILLGGDIIILRKMNLSYDSVFLSYYLNQVKRFNIAQMTKGITIHHLHGKDLINIEVELPSVAEQTRIAAILSDMDAEIAALETKLAKYKQIKQGMMQELLTGKTRLI